MKRPKITRQISSAALGLIAVTALSLAFGLLLFTGSDAGPLPPRSLDSLEEDISDPEPPLASPDGGASAIVPAAGILVAFAFVLVWFLVFRPAAYELPPEQESAEAAPSNQ